MKPKGKKGSISALVTKLVLAGRSDESIVATLRKEFPQLTDDTAKAHVRGARRATGKKAPKTAKRVAVRTPNEAKAA